LTPAGDAFSPREKNRKYKPLFLGHHDNLIPRQFQNETPISKTYIEAIFRKEQVRGAINNEE